MVHGHVRAKNGARAVVPMFLIIKSQKAVRRSFAGAILGTYIAHVTRVGYDARRSLQESLVCLDRLLQVCIQSAPLPRFDGYGFSWASNSFKSVYIDLGACRRGAGDLNWRFGCDLEDSSHCSPMTKDWRRRKGFDVGYSRRALGVMGQARRLVGARMRFAGFNRSSARVRALSVAQRPVADHP